MHNDIVTASERTGRIFVWCADLTTNGTTIAGTRSCDTIKIRFGYSCHLRLTSRAHPQCCKTNVARLPGRNLERTLRGIRDGLREGLGGGYSHRKNV